MRRTSATLRARAGQAALALGNVLRKVVIGASTSGALWSFLGYQTDDDDEGASAEPVEVFHGIGIYARPSSGDNAEAVIGHIGAKSDHPVIVATRNEDARRRYVEEFGDIAAGELALFPSSGDVRIILQADGAIVLEVQPGATIAARSVGGTAEKLATLADVQALRDYVAAITLPVSGGTAGPPTVPPGDPSGTTTLEGE